MLLLQEVNQAAATQPTKKMMSAQQGAVGTAVPSAIVEAGSAAAAALIASASMVSPIRSLARYAEPANHDILTAGKATKPKDRRGGGDDDKDKNASLTATVPPAV